MADKVADLDLKAPWDRQIEFFRQKLALPSKAWDDIQGAAHDRAVIVAGIKKADLLKDMVGAIDKFITEGKSLGWFRDNFDQIVKEHGWDYQGPKNWRTRVIYQTNLSTSYHAGRYQQLTDPELVKLKPFRVYHHGHPATPRPEHLAWDGIALPWDHPWWRTHYTPNGFGCTCWVSAASQREIEARGWKLLDQAPDDGTYRYTVPRTGEVVTLPKGVDYGWDYAPGASVAEQLRPVVEAKLKSLPQSLADALKADVGGKLQSPLERALAEVEQSFREARSTREISAVLDDGGAILARAEGDTKSVPVDPAQARGKTVTHWHPALTSFSPGDIRTACLLSVREMRAADAQYAYSMKPPATGWDAAFWETTARPAFEAAEAEMFGIFWDRLLSGEIDQAEMERELYHAVWTAVAGKTGMIYGRTTP